MKKILIIEDNVILQRMYKKFFIHNNFLVDQIFKGENALPNIINCKPDLILLDIMLSDNINGFDILEQIKRDENLKNIPIIILTNLKSESCSALQLGVKDYMVKSDVDMDEILQKVNSLISQ